MLQAEIAYERKTIPQDWSDGEKAELFRLRQIEGRDWAEIAAQLGRTESGVKSKYKYEVHRRTCREPAPEREPADAEALADRARRLATQARDLTAAIFGDPIPGWSALEQRAA